MRGIFLIILSLTTQAQAQQPEPFGNCSSNVESLYMQRSESLINQYQAASLDRADFEKYRIELIDAREVELSQCAQTEMQLHRKQVKFIQPPVEKSTSIAPERAPASENPVYEEPHSLYDND